METRKHQIVTEARTERRGVNCPLAGQLAHIGEIILGRGAAYL